MKKGLAARYLMTWGGRANHPSAGSREVANSTEALKLADSNGVRFFHLAPIEQPDFSLGTWVLYSSGWAFIDSGKVAEIFKLWDRSPWQYPGNI